jgi:hypothetical protein
MGGIAFTFADRLENWTCEPNAKGEQPTACYLTTPSCDRRSHQATAQI